MVCCLGVGSTPFKQLQFEKVLLYRTFSCFIYHTFDENLSV